MYEIKKKCLQKIKKISVYTDLPPKVFFFFFFFSSSAKHSNFNRKSAHESGEQFTHKVEFAMLHRGNTK